MAKDGKMKAWIQAKAPHIALVWTLVTGLANVSTQLSLVINTLVNPPAGTFQVSQPTSNSDPFNVVFIKDGDNETFGQVAKPSGSDAYVTVPGTGAFEGGSMVFRNGNSSTTDGIYRPYLILTEQKVVYDCSTMEPVASTSPINATCVPQQPELAYTLVVLSFVREAIIMVLLGVLIYNKSFLKKNIEMLAKNSIVGNFWFTGAMTQAKFRELKKDKKLVDLPAWFRGANIVIDLAATNIAVAMASLNVKANSAAGKPLPASSVTMLVFGAISGVGGIVAGCVAVRKWWKERKGGSHSFPL